MEGYNSYAGTGTHRVFLLSHQQCLHIGQGQLRESHPEDIWDGGNTSQGTPRVRPTAIRTRGNVRNEKCTLSACNGDDTKHQSRGYSIEIQYLILNPNLPRYILLGALASCSRHFDPMLFWKSLASDVNLYKGDVL